MRCEMCGDETTLYNAEIEGATMQVCKSCGRLGELQGKVTSSTSTREESEVTDSKEKGSESEPITIVKEDYPQRVKEGREAKGLDQEEMAQRLGEKKSFIHKVETGKAKPSEAVAKKLERFLDITLLEEYDPSESSETGADDTPSMTIGDTVEI